MPLKRPIKLVVTLAIGLAVTLAGAALTWCQISQAELSDNVYAARQVVRMNEKLLDEARGVSERAHSLLPLPCNANTRTELGRLAIGNERIRVINLFNRDNEVCSSWDGIQVIKKDAPANSSQTVTFLTDNFISPGVPVMVLRSPFSEGIITTSMTTLWSAETLRLFSANSPLYLRAGNDVLTPDNHLLTTSSVYWDKNFHSIKSHVYFFSVGYSNQRNLLPEIYLRKGSVSLLLSALLGVAVATGLWQLAFRQKTPYERLDLALTRGEIVPWYQPVVNAGTGIIIGVEVLARYVKPDGTVVSPDHFIPIAESSNLIIPLTRSLMEQVAEELPELLGHADHPWHVGFNMTQAHLLEPDFLEECIAFVNAFVPGSVKLTIELTERESLDNSSAMQKKLKLLHENGIAIALDDFGTGHANLEYISEISVDIIKIDKKFVNRIGQGISGERLLASLIDMAGSLELQIIAEGVETEEQMEWLTCRGLNWLQGYLFSPPIPVSQLSSLIKSGNVGIQHN